MLEYPLSKYTDSTTHIDTNDGAIKEMFMLFSPGQCPAALVQKSLGPGEIPVAFRIEVICLSCGLTGPSKARKYIKKRRKAFVPNKLICIAAGAMMLMTAGEMTLNNFDEISTKDMW